jgi:ApaG protein
MEQLTSQEVTVSAESVYQEAYSSPVQRQYVFAYRIRIANNGSRPVTLLSRLWEVMDATGERRLVEGEGVVGEQPEILPGQFHEYTSWVQFETPIGTMEGHYVMRRTDRNGKEELFPAIVPRFLNIAPEMLN